MRAVVDTNVFLSAALGGRTRWLLSGLITRQFTLVTSEILVRELAVVLSRPAWTRLLSSAQRRELVASIREAATCVTPTQRITVCRDPAGEPILAEADPG